MMVFRTEAEKTAYLAGWNDGFDASRGPGAGGYYVEKQKKMDAKKEKATKSGSEIRNGGEATPYTQGRQNRGKPARRWIPTVVPSPVPISGMSREEK